VTRKGRVLKRSSKPIVAPELLEGKINLSDPDSRVMRTEGTRPRQAYNDRATVNDQQVILAADHQRRECPRICVGMNESDRHAFNQREVLRVSE
jgi:hypothetical protein